MRGDKMKTKNILIIIIVFSIVLFFNNIVFAAKTDSNSTENKDLSQQRNNRSI